MKFMLEAEGCEPEILDGAGDTICSVKKIAIDASPERYGKPTHEECMKILSEKGFSVWRKGWMVFGVNPGLVHLDLKC